MTRSTVPKKWTMTESRLEELAKANPGTPDMRNVLGKPRNEVETYFQKLGITVKHTATN